MDASLWIATANAFAQFGLFGFTPAHVCAVRNAWASVGHPAVGNDDPIVLDDDCDGAPDAEDTDDDGDFVPDSVDSCPGDPTPSQTDTDGDGMGDLCDDDDDGDGTVDADDNCRFPNADQADADDDGIGDACEDQDADGVDDADDNCEEHNPDQEDADGDGEGDACEPDYDGDDLFGFEDDNCPFVANADQADGDGDGLGDACDPCDGVHSPADAWTQGLPALGIDPQPALPDADGDGIPDACDELRLVSIDDMPVVGDAPARLAPDGRRRRIHVDATPGDHLRLPIPVCDPECDAETPWHQVVEIEIDGLPPDVLVWIEDDEGAVADGGDHGGTPQRLLRLRPRGGRRYRLVVRWPEADGPLELEATSRAGSDLPVRPRGCLRDAQCDDGQTCDGVERCDPGVGECRPGAPAPTGDPCTLDSGGAGICRTGTCVMPGCGDGVPSTSEQCDDGNDVDGDGCDRDCTYSCTSLGDCDDSDVCTGRESCNTTTHRCDRGPPLACDDGNPCTADACDMTTGCSNSLIDADRDGYAPSSLGTCGTDCNDGDPLVHPGVRDPCNVIDDDCDGAIDEDMAPVTCFRDEDGDGYPLTGISMGACACPPGWAEPNPGGTDCYDGPGGAAVNPGQTAFQTMGYCPTGGTCTGPLSFDYDCDTREMYRYPTIFVACARTSPTTCVGDGWVGAVAPCGQTRSWQSCTALCSPSTAPETRTQECR
ncbi:MAG: thrombospondin type 3 repeat-containing protein [Deltaproteobacteria bacterium]|nr:thrombospondin type 3 repeat-containing protein [Deltaproteobacteria bacterium]